MYQGKFEKAHELLNTALSIDNTSLEAWNNLGYLYEKKGEVTLAIQAYQTGLSHNSNDALGMANTHTNLGTIYAKQGKWELALDQFQQAVGKYPDFARAHHSLGIVYMYYGKKEEAKREFLEALRLKPDYEQARIFLDKVNH